MFGVAVVAHVVGNNRIGQLLPDTSVLGIATAITGALGLWMIVRPGRRLFLATAVGVLVTVWLEAPLIGNHWLVMGFVALAVLVTAPAADSWSRLAPAARWILLGFYAFAAFAKLNRGFFDPNVSCGVFYANQSLSSAGLPTIASDGWAAMAVIVATVLIEVSVPILLSIPRTRRLGALLGIVFHSVISLDLGQHFYDFTAVLLLLFGLFLDDETVERLEETARGERSIFTLGIASSALLLFAAVGPPSTLGNVALGVGAFVVWIPFVAWFIWSTVRDGVHRVDVDLRVRGVAATAIALAVVANGLSPYLEIKTATGFNMYANLETRAGTSNHFLISRTAQLGSGHDRLYEIVDSDDPDLARYVSSGYLVPERNILHHLAVDGDGPVTARLADGNPEVFGTDDGRRMPVLMEKFLLFRSVDESSPPRCQVAWLPAR